MQRARKLEICSQDLERHMSKLTQGKRSKAITVRSITKLLLVVDVSRPKLLEQAMAFGRRLGRAASGMELVGANKVKSEMRPSLCSCTA